MTGFNDDRLDLSVADGTVKPLVDSTEADFTWRGACVHLDVPCGGKAVGTFRCKKKKKETNIRKVAKNGNKNETHATVLQVHSSLFRHWNGGYRLCAV